MAKISEILSEPYNYKNMNAFPVSEAINKPVNNSREIMDPIGERLMIARWKSQKREKTSGVMNWMILPSI